MPRTATLTTEEFISRAREAHGNRYDYFCTRYLNAKTKVEICCQEHGVFTQLPYAHMRGQGCPNCGKSAITMPQEEFIKKALQVHEGKYDYAKTKYTKGGEALTITCKVHGDFEQVAYYHLQGSGCPLCAQVSRSARQTAKSIEAGLVFCDKAAKVHNGKYDYSLVNYISAATPVIILCQTHGEVYVRPSSHLAGQGCPKCGNLKKGVWKKVTAEDSFTGKATSVHNGKYSYELAEYLGSKTNITIVCPIHGEFHQLPNNHLNGAGCPGCAAGASQGQADIYDLLAKTGLEVLLEDRRIIAPLELDLVLPGRKLAVEYCGLYWHRSSNYAGPNTGSIKPPSYHLDKLAKCEAAGYRLLTVFEDEWRYGKEKTSALLLRSATPGGLLAIGGRECATATITAPEARSFYSANHLSGPASAGTSFGLLHKGELVCVATFSKPRAIAGGEKPKGEYELVRFAQKIGVIVHGALNKLVAAFSASHSEASSIISFVDRRWFTGKTYIEAGFTLEHATKPNYWYVKGTTRFHRYTFAKHKLQELLASFDPKKTEKENMADNGYYTIHDCGSFKLRKPL